MASAAGAPSGHELVVPTEEATKKKQQGLGVAGFRCGGALSKVPAQLGRLRRLTQPYFLDLNGASGWTFTWLLFSLLFVVAGATFGVVAIVLVIYKKEDPEDVEALISGDENGLLATMFELWHNAGGVVILGLCAVGVASFAACRKQLNGRRWLPWLFLGGIVAVLLVINLLNTGIGFIARDLTNALVDRKKDDAYRILMIYGGCFILALPIRSLQYFLTCKLAISWRQWLSQNLIDSYLGNRAYYNVNPNDEENTEIDNPDQRIADDTRTFCRQSLDFTIGAFDALLTFVLNILVLWSISHKLTLVLFAYSGTATLVLILSSHKLVNINYDQLRYEADFRYGLVHIRNNAEAIAFYAGEAPERKETLRRLGSVVSNYNFLIKWEVIISVLRRSYGYAGYFFPYLLMAPAYLAGDLEYGSFVQAKFAFSMVEGSLSFVVVNIDAMAAWWAGISRLEGFQSTIEEINRVGDKQEQLRAHVGQELTASATASTACPSRSLEGEEDLEAGAGSPKRTTACAGSPGQPRAIVLQQVRVQAPGSAHLLADDLNLSVAAGQRLLVVGPSGCGKTSLLRVASGLWQPLAGTVSRPPVGDLLFVPQKPYMLLGSLREQLCYPLPQDSFGDEELRTAMKQVRLPHLVERYPDLGIKQDWPRLLSLGEQQRLAFARLLLNNPSFAVLDEATSALDVATEQMLYEKLTDKGVAIISVGHRPTLAHYHDQVLELRGGGEWRLMAASSYNFAAST